jgi:hypothetical protein
MGASTSWIPLGLSRPVMGLIYLFNITLSLLAGFGVHFSKQNILQYMGCVNSLTFLCILHHELWYNYTTQTKKMHNFLN